MNISAENVTKIVDQIGEINRSLARLADGYTRMADIMINQQAEIDTLKAKVAALEVEPLRYGSKVDLDS